MIEFTLPDFRDKVFKAHDKAVFHKLGVPEPSSGVIFDFLPEGIEMSPNNIPNDADGMNTDVYDNWVEKTIKTDDNILPGDIVFKFPYWDEFVLHAGLSLVTIDKNGDKDVTSYTYGVLNNLNVARLVKALLKANPDFFKGIDTEISDYLYPDQNLNVAGFPYIEQAVAGLLRRNARKVETNKERISALYPEMLPELSRHIQPYLNGGKRRTKKANKANKAKKASKARKTKRTKKQRGTRRHK